ncbi:MAG TPA: ribokinase [Herpetosiphon sp.]|uniref:PfkB domain protein n=1 Tax=Herpetosiphon aurantiacus (strain ATCC 23779 / DSM 785 / 114-95) TaxID=316274 RepID=A9B3W7_HERA2|nr:carbohydrate kinase family protein [Herpetosiphon sp.]ABX06103.1 PfkB domain protein [Herpetosiphon aurantiacus DSM 785]HBW50121.1 ribokinase [Herpetosiphon sp.]
MEHLDTDWRVVVIGGAGLDIKGRLLEPLIEKTSNPGRLTISVGGVARNIAENLARLGAQSSLIAAVGNDEFGRLIIQQTEDAGVDTDAMMILEDQHSAAYLALLDRNGLLYTALDDSHCARALTPDYIYDNVQLLRAADAVFIDANLARATADVILQICAEEDIPVCFEPVAYGLAGRYRDRLRGMYLITPNEREAEALTGLPVTSPAEATAAAKELVRLGVEIAIITLAREGLVYATADGHGHIPTLVRDVVDATGAGDALAAAVLFGLMNELTLDEAVRLGASAAALTVASPDTVRRDLSLESLYAQLLI